MLSSLALYSEVIFANIFMQLVFEVEYNIIVIVEDLTIAS